MLPHQKIVATFDIRNATTAINGQKRQTILQVRHDGVGKDRIVAHHSIQL